jgi:phage-related protein
MWRVTWEQNKTVFIFVWDLIVAITKTVIAVIGGIIIVFLALLSGNWKAAWENIKQIVSFAWEGIKNALNSGLAMIGGWARQVFDKLTQPFRDALAFIKDTVNKIKDNLDFTKRHSPSVLDIVNNGVDKVNSALSGLNFAPAIDLMPSSGQFAGAMQDVENSTRIVNQENIFNVASGVDARILSEQLAFDLRNI